MTKLELETIVSQLPNLKNLPNNVLINFMDLLTTDFEDTKKKLFELTYHLDSVEEYYNTIIKEFENRTK
jgi:NADH:ubiquinone oxidoreductase subunit C